MVLLLLIYRCLCHHCNNVIAFIAMASLPLPVRRCLAVVKDDDNGATGNDNEDNRDGAKDDQVDDNDGSGARMSSACIK